MNQKPNESDSLRNEAEAWLEQEAPAKIPARSAEELLHELQVHQIELEMQNEELQRSQLAFEEFAARYVDLYDFAPIGYLTLNRGGMIDEINLTCAALMGVERNKLINRRFAPFVTFEDSDLWHQYFMHAKQQSEKQCCELALKRNDGSVFHAQLTSQRIESPRGISVRMTLTDITERKRMENEAQQRRNEMAELHTLHVASQTASAIAHELNQPLLSIATYSEIALMLMQDKNPDLEKLFKAIECCERQSLRAGKTIHELLEFLSKGEYPTEQFELNSEIHNTLNAAKSEHELRFDFVFRGGEGISPVRANRAHVQKVLLNLLHNGIDAMQEASVALPAFFVTVQSNHSEGAAQVTIQDNGPGIKPDDLHRLFEPFFTTKAKGIGMGLAVSRSLIEENGGRIWAELRNCDQLCLDPQDRTGATFHFTLPFAS